MDQTLRNNLNELSAEGELYDRLDEQHTRCVACGHNCIIAEGRFGICNVRFNRGGTLRVPKDYVAAYRVHPVEINTIYHVRPGAPALTFGMFGCDFHCPYCQNWTVSQALREAQAPEPAPVRISAHALVEQAVRENCRVICSAYNEPLITSEWAVEIFREAKKKGLITAYITDGNATDRVLQYLRPWLDIFRVDLKAGTPEHYRRLGGRLEVVLNALERARALGFWVEVVTLIVPHFNDDINELRALAKYLASISTDIPWHLNAFYPNYKMQDRSATSVQILSLAAGLAYAQGMKYVYVGNATGAVPGLENTYCPTCRQPVIERKGYTVIKNGLIQGACPEGCGLIPGLW